MQMRIATILLWPADVFRSVFGCVSPKPHRIGHRQTGPGKLPRKVRWCSVMAWACSKLGHCWCRMISTISTIGWFKSRSGRDRNQLALRRESTRWIAWCRDADARCGSRRNSRLASTITYDVLCPTHEPAIKGVQPRDINNFWMATDPDDPDRGLFDSKRYTGKFSFLRQNARLLRKYGRP